MQKGARATSPHRLEPAENTSLAAATRTDPKKGTEPTGTFFENPRTLQLALLRPFNIESMVFNTVCCWWTGSDSISSSLRSTLRLG
jgi:hypothetical protein